MAARTGTISPNRQFVVNLKKEADKLPKKMLAAYAAHALAMCMTSTRIDSGRATANWNLASGNHVAGARWNPEKYYGSMNGATNIGGRKDPPPGGLDELTSYKLAYYGVGYYKGAMGKVNDQGKLARMVGVHRPGPAKKVWLYNPIYSTNIPSYTYNAFRAVVPKEEIEAGVYEAVGGEFRDAIRVMARIFK